MDPGRQDGRATTPLTLQAATGRVMWFERQGLGLRLEGDAEPAQFVAHLPALVSRACWSGRPPSKDFVGEARRRFC